MRIGFLLGRRTHAKILGPVIDEAIRRGHVVNVHVNWRDQSERLPERLDYPEPWWQREASWENWWRWNDAVVADDDVLRRISKDVPSLPRLISIPYFFGNIAFEPWFSDVVIVCYISEYHQRRHVE